MVGNRWCPVAAGSPGGLQQITFFLLPFISSTRQRQSKGAKSCLISAFFCRRLMVKVFSRDSLDTVLLTMLDFTSFSSGVFTINSCEFSGQNTDKSHQFLAAATTAQRHFFLLSNLVSSMSAGIPAISISWSSRFRVEFILDFGVCI